MTKQRKACVFRTFFRYHGKSVLPVSIKSVTITSAKIYTFNNVCLYMFTIHTWLLSCVLVWGCHSFNVSNNPILNILLQLLYVEFDDSQEKDEPLEQEDFTEESLTVDN